MSKTIIDCKKKGNIVRFYLGEKEPEWGWTNKDYKNESGETPAWLEPSDIYEGDDWDDAPYEHNAGTVYEEFIKGTVDVAFGYDDLVIEPSFGYLNSNWCKEDMRERKIPCLIVIPEDVLKANNLHEWNVYNFNEAMKIDGAIKYYFGDPVESITYGEQISYNIEKQNKLESKGNYRLENISTFVKGKLPYSEGLGLEKRTSDGHYYVILFIRYDNEEKAAYFDVVSNRLTDIPESEWGDVLYLLKEGSKIVELENKKEEE